ncbi:MAG: ATP-dependent Clp protease proteolytic subunit [Candidatus Kaiserbacteria bacterium]|nr:ATP-dependent Clp protease proteolytic subunit [Candidatus Kaiserbacteria bacterium]
MEIWYTLTGDVEKRSAQDAIQWINEQLYSKPVTHLRFLVASAGGDIDTGTNLYMYLKSLPVEVETIGFGVVDAAAALIFLGGKKRLAVDGCRFFFHEGQYTVPLQTAPLSSHEEALSVFRRNLHEMIYIIARETGNDTEVVANMLRKSKIMQTSEALEFGLCSDIIEKLPLQQQEAGFGFRESGSIERESRPLSKRRAQPLRAESEDDRRIDQ